MSTNSSLSSLLIEAGLLRLRVICHWLKQKLTERNGFETQQISLLYVFVHFFGLDRAENIIANRCLLCTEDLVNRNVLVTKFTFSM